MVRLPNESGRQYGTASCTKTAVAASLCDAPSELLITRASRRPQGDDYRLRANRAQAARARRCVRRETAIRPTAESTPELWKIEPPEPVRQPAAHEQNDCNCRTQPSSLRSCARRD